MVRMLSIGITASHPRIEDSDFFNAPSFFDFDVMFVDPLEVANQVQDVVQREISVTRTGKRIGNGGTVAPDYVPLATFLGSRKAEVNRMMSRGGVLVCFLRPPSTIDGIRGLNDWTLYEWLPRPLLHMYDQDRIIPASSELSGVLMPEHPFTYYFEAYDDPAACDAFFGDWVRRIGEYIPIAQNRGGYVAACQFQSGSGSLIFLPPRKPQDSDAEDKFGGVLWQCAQAFLSGGAPIEEPPWADDFDVPGLDKSEEDVDAAHIEVKNAEAALAESVVTRDELKRLRSMLWTQGKYLLEPTVRRAFVLLGFDQAEPKGDVDAVLTEAMEVVALAEIEGTKGLVGVRKYRQLRQYVDDDFIESGTRKKGILVGNARIDLHPGERGEQFSEEVRRGADGQKFCLLPTTELFRLVQLVLAEGADRRLDLRKSLLQHVGVFTAPRDQPGNTPDDGS